MSTKPDECLDCGAELPDGSSGREPCPSCGSSRRRKFGSASISGVGRLEVSGRARLAWDGVSLTLAGVIYGILITVAAVLIAPESLAARLAFGAVTLAVLVAALAFAQPVIAAMRWILKRATR